jgi:hypothetical protein
VVVGVMTAMALLGLTVFVLTEQIRRHHDWALPKPQRGSHRFVGLIAQNFWILFLVFTWIVGLVLLLLWKRSRDTEAEPHPAQMQFLKGFLGVAVVFGLACALVAAFLGGTPSPSDESGPAPALVRTVAPANLEGLGYLPGDANVVAALHVAELLREPAGRDFLTQFRLGATDFSLATVEKWTGLKPEEIDHVVVGVKVADRLVPRLTLVVQTTRPLDQEKVRTALRTNRLPEFVRFATNRTLLLALTAKDLDQVPQAPAAGIDHLSLPLQDLLRHRLGREAPVWLVGFAEHWDKTVVGPLFVTSLPRKEREALTGVQAFGLWLQFDQQVTLNGAAECTDDSGAERLNQYLDRWDKEGLKHVHDKTWVSLQAKTSAEALRQALDRPGNP